MLRGSNAKPVHCSLRGPPGLSRSAGRGARRTLESPDPGSPGFVRGRKPRTGVVAGVVTADRADVPGRECLPGGAELTRRARAGAAETDVIPGQSRLKSGWTIFARPPKSEIGSAIGRPGVGLLISHRHFARLR